jgi:uncharacterized membrane protein YjgN (DUF898 family)
VLQPPTLMVSPQTTRFEYRGQAGELFVLWLKNSLLSLVTLGLYSFKARVEVRKHYWRNIYFGGQPFAFAGKARDQLRGMAWLLMILVMLACLGGGAALAVHPLAAIPFAIVGLSLLGCRIKFGSVRYRARNTIYRGLRGNIQNEVFKMYLKEALRGAVFNVLTLGIYSPFNQINLMRIRWDNTSWGNQKFSFSGQGTEYFWILFKGSLLSALTLGLYTPWLLAARYRYVASHLSFMGRSFKLELTGGKMALILLKTFVLTTLTLGLALPWTVTWTLREIAASLHYMGEADFDQVVADARAQLKSSADMAGDLADLDADIELAF